jgi:hypothetical protein
MVHVSRFDSYIGDLKIAFDELVVTDLGAHLIEPHREISVLHLSGQRVLHGLPEPLRRVDVPLVARLEKWGKEWNSLNVIPMRMTKEYVALAHGLGAIQRLAETVKTTPTVDDHKRAGGCSHLEARGIPAEPQSIGSRLR